jgi:hypothetical protein
MSSTTEGILYLGGVDGNGMSIGIGGDISNLLQLEFRASNVKIATVTEASTSSTTGTIQVPDGGIGVAGASYFGSTVTVGNATSGGHAVNRTTGDGRYGQLTSANTWTQDQSFSNDAIFQNGVTLTGDGANGTVVYAGGDTRTFTIPAVAGSRTFAFINQEQTFSKAQTFEHDRLKVRNTGDNGSATIRYGTASADRTYTLSGNSGTIWHTGNFGVGVSGPGVVTPNQRLILTINGTAYTIAVQQ